eukprot:572038-Prymnesium_polylepis.1
MAMRRVAASAPLALSRAHRLAHASRNALSLPAAGFAAQALTSPSPSSLPRRASLSLSLSSL